MTYTFCIVAVTMVILLWVMKTQSQYTYIDTTIQALTKNSLSSGMMYQDYLV